MWATVVRTHAVVSQSWAGSKAHHTEAYFLREPLSRLRVPLADVGTAVNTRSRGGMLPESPSTLGPKPFAAQPPPPSAGAGVGDVTGAGAGAGGGAGASSGATGTPPPQCGVCSKGFTSFRRRHYCKYVQRVSSTSAKQRACPALCACIVGLECVIVISYAWLRPCGQGLWWGLLLGPLIPPTAPASPPRVPRTFPAARVRQVSKTGQGLG